nr:uncharacterized mitochondrial protein AtMg00810-like [Tanacetum cinerariifolium]GEX65098.1 uncharacterized mitochondrial protein AtMg00810-like [Tanacetum cinerariifolium]
MDVRRIKEEVDPDFLSDAHSRTGLTESVELIVRFPSIYRLRISWIPIGLVFYVLCSAFRFASFVKSKGALDLCSLIIFMGLHEVKRGAQVTFEDEFGAAEEREVLCEAQKGRSGVKRKLFGSFKNNMGNEPILALPEGMDDFIVMREARAWWFMLLDRICVPLVGDVRTLIMEEAHTTKYYVRPEAEIGESKMIGLEMEQETTKVVVIKERLKEAKDHQERVKLIEGASFTDVLVYVDDLLITGNDGSQNSSLKAQLSLVFHMKDLGDLSYVLGSEFCKSSQEAEYKDMTMTCCEVTWLVCLLKDLGIKDLKRIELFCDNQAALYIAANPVFHARTKHIEFDCHYVRDKLKTGNTKPSYVHAKS